MCAAHLAERAHHRPQSLLPIGIRRVDRPDLLDQFGAAMNSGRPLLVYGPAGSGKTYISERLVGLLTGDVAIPHAIEVGNEVIQLFDPVVHHPTAHDGPRGAGLAALARYVEERNH